MSPQLRAQLRASSFPHLGHGGSCRFAALMANRPSSKSTIPGNKRKIHHIRLFYLVMFPEARAGVRRKERLTVWEACVEPARAPIAHAANPNVADRPASRPKKQSRTNAEELVAIGRFL